MTSFWCESAFIDGSIEPEVVIDVGQDGVIAAVTSKVPRGESQPLEGVVFPGFANTHSHAFHRRLRGQLGAAQDFWTWREEMYRLADTLDPDSYLELATSVYQEMVGAGFTVVGEFHYLHHQPGGNPYLNPNQMGEALLEAARRAGIRITLLDACYLEGGIGAELSESQLRFSDGDVSAWFDRHQRLQPSETARIGAAIHSVRAMTPAQIAELTQLISGGPLHVHLAEQLAERDSALATFGASPTKILADAGALTPRTTCVHSIHLDPADVDLIADSGATVCACPTTEADLGDGIGPFAILARAGVALTLGTDQHTSIDPFEEAARLELDQRLSQGSRQVFDPAAMVDILSLNGYRSLGWDHGGRIAPGFLADLVVIDNESPRTSGVEAEMLPTVARSGDVISVVVGGRTVIGPHS